jgi:Flp pilus assembly protein TadG
LARRRDDERGTALVEAAIVIPLLMLLTFGAIELGIGFSQKGALESIARSGGRTGATLAGDAQLADKAVAAVNGALATTAVPELNQMYVYKINGATGVSEGPAGWGGACAGNCVRIPFNGSQFDMTSASGAWPVAARDACSLNADRVGIQVDGKFEFLTNLVGSGKINLIARSVHQLEPTNC